MTPELAAERAAQALDKAAAMSHEQTWATALVAVADGWTRLHTALANAPKTIEPTPTVHIEGLAVKEDADMAKIGEPVPPDLSPIRAALAKLPVTCRYHGNKTKPRDGFPGREACCDSGIPARRRRVAAETLQALSDFFNIG